MILNLKLCFQEVVQKGFLIMYILMLRREG